MRVDPYRFARMADPDFNNHFRRRWSEPAMSPRELEYLSEIAAARGNWQRSHGAAGDSAMSAWKRLLASPPRMALILATEQQTEQATVLQSGIGLVTYPTLDQALDALRAEAPR